jgi:hypothetical protein
MIDCGCNNTHIKWFRDLICVNYTLIVYTGEISIL